MQIQERIEKLAKATFRRAVRESIAGVTYLNKMAAEGLEAEAKELCN